MANCALSLPLFSPAPARFLTFHLPRDAIAEEHAQARQWYVCATVLWAETIDWGSSLFFLSSNSGIAET